MATHSSILAWRITMDRNLVDCGPRGCKESDMTEQLGIYVIEFRFVFTDFLPAGSVCR